VAPVSSLALFLEGAGLLIAGLLIRSFFSGSLGRHRSHVQSVSDLLIAHYDIGALGASARRRRPSPVYAAGFALLFTALLTFGASSIHFPGARPLQGPPLDEVTAELEAILTGLRARIATLSVRLEQLTANEVSPNGGSGAVQRTQPKPRPASAQAPALLQTLSDARDSVPEPPPRVMYRAPVEEARVFSMRHSSAPRPPIPATATITSKASAATEVSRPESPLVRAADVVGLSSDRFPSSADSRQDPPAAVDRSGNTGTDTDQIGPAHHVDGGQGGAFGDGDQRGAGAIGKLVPPSHEKDEGAGRKSTDKPTPSGQIDKVAKIDRSDAEGKVERSQRVDKTGRPEKVEKIEKIEKVEKIEKIERPAKLERIERIEKIEKPERVEKIERIEKVERPTKPEKVEKVERVEKVDRLAKPEKPVRPGK
jgi:hypothetical protein